MVYNSPKCSHNQIQTFYVFIDVQYLSTIITALIKTYFKLLQLCVFYYIVKPYQFIHQLLKKVLINAYFPLTATIKCVVNHSLNVYIQSVVYLFHHMLLRILVLHSNVLCTICSYAQCEQQMDHIAFYRDITDAAEDI